MFRQDRTNPSTAISNWRGRHDTPKAWPSTAVSSWLNGGLFGAVSSGAGYIGGGQTSGTIAVTTIDKFAFSDDARSTLGSGLGSAVYLLSAFGNAGVAGYFAGGNGPVQEDAIWKTNFADDTQSTLSAVLPDNVNTQASCSNVAVAGYTSGGESSGGSQTHDDIDKLTYSTEAMSTLGNTLPQGRRQLAAFANSGTAGYWAGGNQGSSPYAIDDISKLVFSGETTSTLAEILSPYDCRQSTGFANSGVAGYTCIGKGNGSVRALVYKLTFASDTGAYLGTGLSTASDENSAMANSGTAGYVALGVGFATTVDKFAFADDSRSTLGTGLSTSRKECAGMANEGSLA
jgi:hypothetical protein